MPLLSLTGILKNGLLKVPATAFSLCCKSIRIVNLPEDAIKSIIQDFTCLPAPLHYAGKSGACLLSALNLLLKDQMLSRCYFPKKTDKSGVKIGQPGRTNA
jgi:hypothetical protein